MINNCRKIVSSGQKHQRKTLPPAVQQLILESLNNLQYGVLEITVHENRVVQIEKREKIRLK